MIDDLNISPFARQVRVMQYLDVDLIITRYKAQEERPKK